MDKIKLCDYGCGREAHFQFKNGKWCCSKKWQSCPFNRNRISLQNKKEWENPHSKFNSDSYRKKLRDDMKELWETPTSKLNSVLCKEKLSKLRKLSLEQIEKRCPTFIKEEEIRYNPDKPLEERKIQVHCKNHECENSKEKGGWFTPTYSQIGERIRQLEKEHGNGGSYFYCSQYCKDNCSLYNIQSDPYKDNNKPCTSAELKVFNKHILKRDNEICYYCKKHHATIVHHLRPQKLEPFFALDPDYAISVCAKCHYKYGHPTGSEHSTGNLAKIVCSVESQKFLNQK